MLDTGKNRLGRQSSNRRNDSGCQHRFKNPFSTRTLGNYRHGSAGCRPVSFPSFDMNFSECEKWSHDEEGDLKSRLLKPRPPNIFPHSIYDLFEVRMIKPLSYLFEMILKQRIRTDGIKRKIPNFIYNG